MNETYQRYHAAAARMDALIDMTPTPTDLSWEALNERALLRLHRLVEFLEMIGSPHRGRPVVHIAGTSGKGSTSTIIASILTAAGYRTGLHVSPYLQTPAEKLQLNGQNVSPDGYADLVDEFFRAHDAWLVAGNEPLSYYEGFNALMWMFFRRMDVEFGVVETGVGGRFDLTNIADPSMSVITSVGIDHTQLLGSTIEKIAWNKAGIIKSGIPAMSSVSDPVAQHVVREEAALVGAPLYQLDLDTEIDDVTTDARGTHWREVETGMAFSTGLAGSFQARNGYLAARAMRILRDHGFHISDEAIREGLLQARIPGRAEFIQDRVPVLLDGAHNAEKVAAIARDIPYLLPTPYGRRIVVAGLLESKQGHEMLQSLAPVVDVIVATSPRVLAKESLGTSGVEAYAREAGFTGPIYEEADPRKAIELALSLATPGEDAIVVTGSLYLVGNIRERWYPEHRILAANSSWPEVAVTP